MCGPRHVTEEAAKRDKESLDGKPIVEQRAIIQRLRHASIIQRRKAKRKRRNEQRAIIQRLRHAKVQRQHQRRLRHAIMTCDNSASEATPRKGSLCAQQTVQLGSTAVQVKRGKTEKHRPFFQVRLRIDGLELCGPRHVTEEAAKRDKESLNGKPIVEQLSLIHI